MTALNAFENVSLPAVYAAALTLFSGLQLEDWILWGTALLLVLNISLKSYEVYDRFRRNKDK